MSRCERIRTLAPGLAALPPDDPERLAAEAHARECSACAGALREAAKLQELLEVPHEPLPADMLERASAGIREELRREIRRRMAWAAVAAGAAGIVVVAFARHHALPAPLDGAVAIVLWIVAVALAGAASRRPVAALALAMGASLAAAALAGSPGRLVASIGLECLATELGSAAIVVGAAWLALRGGTTSPPRIAVAATAAAGALAGAAALQLTCPAHASLPHLLVFHVGALLAATVAAQLLWRPPGQAQPA